MNGRTRSVLVAVLLVAVSTVTVGSTDPSPPVVDSCGGGAPIAKPGGGYWNCTFDDEFDGTSLDTSKWTGVATATSGFHSGPECFFPRVQNVAVGHGLLALVAQKEAAPFTCVSPRGNYTTQYTSGSVMTLQKFSQTYGRFDVRAAFPAATVPGLQSTLWLYPVDANHYGPWPASGEIDFAEAYSQHPDRVIPYVHYNAAAYDPNVTNNYCFVLDVSALHDYVVEWTPDTITVTIDSTTCLSDSWNPAAPLAKPQPFDQPFFLALTQALGIGNNSFDPATTPLPAITVVDYVRVWS